MSGTTWKPSATYVEQANVTRLMRAHGIGSLAELRQRSIEDISWYWDAVVRDLGIEFSRPYEQVLDRSGGAPWGTWFVDGQLNLVTSCVDRWARSAPTQERIALIGESETGAVRQFSFGRLRAEIDQFAAALMTAGIGKGDAVAVFMPMVPEAIIAAYAIAKLGAIYVPIFSGFAATAVAARLEDAGAKLLITADGSSRRGRYVPMKDVADAAMAQVSGIERVVVFEHVGEPVAMAAGRDVFWAEFVAAHEGVVFDAVELDAEHPFMIAYTSGTTGRPKGAVHVHGGFLVKIASECAYQTDVRPGEPLQWVTDMGWLMGPFGMIGAHANGATMVVCEGAPDHPNPGKLWATVERHRIGVLGVSPTLVRALKRHGDAWPARHDLSSLRILGSTGEPWNPDPYQWLQRVAGAGRVPIINLSGGTEVGACLLSPYPVEPIKVCSVGGASLGMDVDVFDAAGQPVRDELGELVCRQPWPGMTRGLWRDPKRYLETYWSMYPDVWRHGDWAKIDREGHWFLYGRSDETINVAGKRLGPAELESILVSHPSVTEAAVVGVPDETKGEAIWCFVVASEPDASLSVELADLVAQRMARAFRPARVVLVDALPKTRSAKILRRAVRAVAVGEDPGDLSSAENPEVVDAIRRSLATTVAGAKA